MDLEVKIVTIDVGSISNNYVESTNFLRFDI